MVDIIATKAPNATSSARFCRTFVRFTRSSPSPSPSPSCTLLPSLAAFPSQLARHRPFQLVVKSEECAPPDDPTRRSLRFQEARKGLLPSRLCIIGSSFFGWQHHHHPSVCVANPLMHLGIGRIASNLTEVRVILPSPLFYVGKHSSSRSTNALRVNGASPTDVRIHLFPSDGWHALPGLSREGYIPSRTSQIMDVHDRRALLSTPHNNQCLVPRDPAPGQDGTRVHSTPCRDPRHMRRPSPVSCSSLPFLLL